LDAGEVSGVTGDDTEVVYAGNGSDATVLRTGAFYCARPRLEKRFGFFGVSEKPVLLSEEIHLSREFYKAIKGA